MNTKTLQSVFTQHQSPGKNHVEIAGSAALDHRAVNRILLCSLDPVSTLLAVLFRPASATQCPIVDAQLCKGSGTWHAAQQSPPLPHHQAAGCGPPPLWQSMKGGAAPNKQHQRSMLVSCQCVNEVLHKRRLRRVAPSAVSLSRTTALLVPPCPACQPICTSSRCSAAASGNALALGEERRQLVVDGRIAWRRRPRRGTAGRGVQALCPQLLLPGGAGRLALGAGTAAAVAAVG